MRITSRSKFGKKKNSKRQKGSHQNDLSCSKFVGLKIFNVRVSRCPKDLKQKERNIFSSEKQKENLFYLFFFNLGKKQYRG